MTDERLLQETIAALKQADGDDLSDWLTTSLRAFESMLERGRDLTQKQRAWVERVADELNVEAETPSERNARVPRGREVEPAPVLRNLPKSPPRRGAS